MMFVIVVVVVIILEDVVVFVVLVVVVVGYLNFEVRSSIIIYSRSGGRAGNGSIDSCVCGCQ